MFDDEPDLILTLIKRVMHAEGDSASLETACAAYLKKQLVQIVHMLLQHEEIKEQRKRDKKAEAKRAKQSGTLDWPMVSHVFKEQIRKYGALKKKVEKEKQRDQSEQQDEIADGIGDKKSIENLVGGKK